MSAQYGVPMEPLIKPIMNHVADKNEMIVRRAAQVVVILRCQGAQHSERSFLLQPLRALALRAVCGIMLLAKGITIRVVTSLHPIPQGRVRGHVGLNQWFPIYSGAVVNAENPDHRSQLGGRCHADAADAITTQANISLLQH